MNERFNYDDIAQTIENQLRRVFEDSYGDSGYSLIAEQERIFLQRHSLTPKTIYITISFGSGSTNPQQATLPVYLEAISEDGAFEVARGLLAEFSAKYSSSIKDGQIQVWGSPLIAGKYTEIGKGFRACVYLNGTLSTAGKSALGISSIYWKNGNAYEAIPYLSITSSYQASAAPQAYPNTNGFAKSEIAYGTYTLSIATIPYGNLMEAIDALKYAGGHENDVFKLKLVKAEDDSGSPTDTGNEIDFKLLSATETKIIGQNPAIALVFTL